MCVDTQPSATNHPSPGWPTRLGLTASRLQYRGSAPVAGGEIHRLMLGVRLGTTAPGGPEEGGDRTPRFGL